MSRVAKKPITIPTGVEIKLEQQMIVAKGPKGRADMQLHARTKIEQLDGELKIVAETKDSAMAGTMRALLSNLVIGVSVGFQKKLLLVGVGYRAQVQGNKINLALGYSHPIEYGLPAGITAETPSQTEIIISGIDKQKVGQVAAEIRALRPPEPYKGKGVRLADETIVRKEAKKK